MRDSNTQIYRFVIQDPPPREVAAPIPESFDVPHSDPEPTPPPHRHRHGRTTPGRLATPRRPLPPRRPSGAAGPPVRMLVAAGLLIGLGIGGSIDGSAFHQLVQYHAGGTPEALVGVKTDPLWDSLLHAFTWLAMLLGLGLLWRSTRRPAAPLRASTFIGSLLLGWGLFNGIEGAIDLHLLQSHHAHPVTAQLLWDGGLITSGMALLLAGTVCIAFGRR